MGTLVKTAQAVEERVGLVRKEFRTTVQSKMQEAEAEWLELKRRRSGPTANRTELYVRAFLLRTDSRLRLEIARLIGRSIAELEKIRRTLAREE